MRSVGSVRSNSAVQQVRPVGERGPEFARSTRRKIRKMDPRFFEQPILNSPYEYPSRHWELDASGQPTTRILPKPRTVAFITPIPEPKKSGAGQPKMAFDGAAQALGTEAQQYDLTVFLVGVRQRVDRWRELPDPNSWQVTPKTSRPVQHWRSDRFGDIRPFFCQVQAVETPIWLTEVASQEEQAGAAGPRSSRPSQRGGQSRPRAGGAEARHRGQEDHREGDDHRLPPVRERATQSLGTLAKIN